MLTHSPLVIAGKKAAHPIINPDWLPWQHGVWDNTRLTSIYSTLSAAYMHVLHTHKSLVDLCY